MDKLHRVRKNEDFQSIIKDKKSVANSKFVVYYKKNNLSLLRVGFSVSKKLGKAVIRNKTKRQVRMMAREIFDQNQSMDYIIIVRNKFLESSYEENKKDLLFLYNKINRRMDK
ncbi:MAG: ribonuclease P protein component [Bacilli bacterium]|nr:ribonuclease P protein component [Bacilli bacterium]